MPPACLLSSLHEPRWPSRPPGDLPAGLCQEHRPYPIQSPCGVCVKHTAFLEPSILPSSLAASAVTTATASSVSIMSSVRMPTHIWQASGKSLAGPQRCSSQCDSNLYTGDSEGRRCCIRLPIDMLVSLSSARHPLVDVSAIVRPVWSSTGNSMCLHSTGRGEPGFCHTSVYCK